MYVRTELNKTQNSKKWDKNYATLNCVLPKPASFKQPFILNAEKNSTHSSLYSCFLLPNTIPN